MCEYYDILVQDVEFISLMECGPHLTIDSGRIKKLQKQDKEEGEGLPSKRLRLSNVQRLSVKVIKWKCGIFSIDKLGPNVY